MSQFSTELQAEERFEQEEFFASAGRIPDYDDQPYGDDNLLVRAMRRRSLLTGNLEL